MTKTDSHTFRLTPAMRAALDAIYVRDGVTVGEQIRRGVQLWIDLKASEAKSRTLTRRLAAKALKAARA